LDALDAYVPMRRSRGYLVAVANTLSTPLNLHRQELVKLITECVKSLRRPPSVPVEEFLLPKREDISTEEKPDGEISPLSLVVKR